MQIVVLTKTNPKRREAARRFSFYRTGMSPAEYAEAVGDTRQALRDLLWDLEQGFIDVRPRGESH